jgi:hypothetical protein
MIYMNLWLMLSNRTLQLTWLERCARIAAPRRLDSFQRASHIQGESKKTDTFDIQMNNKGVSFFLLTLYSCIFRNSSWLGLKAVFHLTVS